MGAMLVNATHCTLDKNTRPQTVNCPDSDEQSGRRHAPRKSVLSRGRCVATISGRADFRAMVPEGTPPGNLRAASELVGTAKTPSPRPNQIIGGNRSRAPEKSPSSVAVSDSKAHKSCQSWGSVSAQQSDAFHPGSSSKNNKRKASPKNTLPETLPYKGFRIPKSTNISPNNKGKGIMKAKEAVASLNGDCEPTEVRNSVRIADIITTESDVDTNIGEDTLNEANSSPQASGMRGIN
eukprot:40795-Pleurochrysis_carterae.AAC.2